MSCFAGLKHELRTHPRVEVGVVESGQRQGFIHFPSQARPVFVFVSGGDFSNPLEAIGYALRIRL